MDGSGGRRDPFRAIPSPPFLPCHFPVQPHFLRSLSGEVGWESLFSRGGMTMRLEYHGGRVTVLLHLQKSSPSSWHEGSGAGQSRRKICKFIISGKEGAKPTVASWPAGVSTSAWKKREGSLLLFLVLLPSFFASSSIIAAFWKSSLSPSLLRLPPPPPGKGSSKGRRNGDNQVHFLE